MGKPPKPAKPATQASAEVFPWNPWIVADPVPPWIRDRVDIKVLRDMAAVQMRAQRTILEEQAKAIAEMERLIKG